MTVEIGSWVKRPFGKWHRVESIVSDDAITACGRRMVPENGSGKLEVAASEPFTRAIGQPQLCRAGCQ